MSTEKHLSIHTIVIVSFLSVFLFIGGFAVLTTSGVVSRPFSPAVMGDEDEEKDGEEKDDEESEDSDEKDEKDNEKDEEEEEEKETEEKKKSEKKTDEKEKESVKNSFTSAVGGYQDDKEDEMEEGEENGDEKDEVKEEDEADEMEEQDEEDESLKEIREKVMEAEKEILEGMKEGADATVALEKIAAAKSTLDAIQAAIAAGNLEEAKQLARETKKMVYFAKEDDFHSAKKSSERLKDVTEKFAKAEEKVALVASIGGDTTTLTAGLVEAQDLLNQGRSALSAGDYAAAETSFRSAKSVVNRVKDAAEMMMYALGKSDDEFDDEYEDFVKELSGDLDEIAEIESDENRSAELKRIVDMQKQSGLVVASAVQLAQERSALARFFFGSDDDSLKSISARIAGNTENAQALRTLAQSSGDADIQTLLMEQAERIEAENAKLQAFVTAQSQSNGLLGWLADLFR